ncbi:GNAT family N-acetyltransferase [Aeoliella sp.]|uniref:GNAT family N-acetyltransferase n=1 Tax=Aeoliella sp. TaxID=2795800 RepID=UPI003CCC3B91
MHISLSCPVHDSFRVQQVAGMFDVPLAERLSEEFDVELPTGDDWQVGLIVGPSGSGKSSVARRAFGDSLHTASQWLADRAVIDCFEGLSVRKTTELLTAVGFSSPPSWIKPYAVLSNGERFRCDLARALAKGEGPHPSPPPKGEGIVKSLPPWGEGWVGAPTIAFDEFTSVVDRNVARVCSAAVARAVRTGRVNCRFVAVTCHYDVAEWLEADWVLDMATRTLTRRCLRRPTIELQVHRTDLKAWSLFARHHYLSGTLAPQSECYVTTWNGEPVNFCATIPVIGYRGRRRFTRIVTLPDYQGIGIGMRSVRAVAQLHRQRGHRVSVTSSHPALIQHCKHSTDWKAVSVKKTGRSRTSGSGFGNYRSSTGRAIVSFEFVG